VQVKGVKFVALVLGLCRRKDGAFLLRSPAKPVKQNIPFLEQYGGCKDCLNLWDSGLAKFPKRRHSAFKILNFKARENSDLSPWRSPGVISENEVVFESLYK